MVVERFPRESVDCFWPEEFLTSMRRRSPPSGPGGIADRELRPNQFFPTPGVEGEALPWSELVGRVRPRWPQTHGHRGSWAWKARASTE